MRVVLRQNVREPELPNVDNIAWLRTEELRLRQAAHYNEADRVRQIADWKDGQAHRYPTVGATSPVFLRWAVLSWGRQASRINAARIERLVQRTWQSSA